ncbi:spermine oxidase-like isoform X2 [Drosophila hydei]|uniref:Spermine oxidase-like isoform X2 n=1 Tax=Drosophila hydei TaxID=7224 RepID=A0A6J1MJ18_DROHY|nr:spermine oxidase-like isoform X2 [Drosophila hydei]
MGSCWSNQKAKLARNKTRPTNSVYKCEPRILILGGGVAGLACAVELKTNGYNNVRIVEMSDRIGGRVKTLKFADNYVDMGAQWVYGQKGNVVYQMVKELNILEKSDDTLKNINWIRSNGDELSKSVVEEMLNLISTIYYKMQDDQIDPEASFGEYVSQMFYREMDKRHRHLDRHVAKEFITTFKKIEGSMMDVSAYDYWTFKPCKGCHHLNWREKGFKEFLRILVKGDEMNEHGILKDCIDLNQKVIQIEWDRIDGSVVACSSATQCSFGQICQKLTVQRSISLDLPAFAKYLLNLMRNSGQIIGAASMPYGEDKICHRNIG